MAELHPEATLVPSKLEMVTAWIGRQRWFVGLSEVPTLRLLHRWRLDDPAGEVGLEILVVVDETVDDRGEPVPGHGVVYQVPLTYRSAALPDAEHALVGTMEHSMLGARWVHDGCHDPVFARELLRLCHGDVAAASSFASHAVDEGVTSDRHAGWTEELPETTSRVLVGEQSNTSMLHLPTTPGATPIICKLFRTLAPGRNPDVELQGLLSDAGVADVPRMLGSVSVTWPAPADGAPVVGDVAVAQELLAGAQDAFRVCLELARRGESLGPRARDLGAATARVHAALARLAPTRACTTEDVDRFVDGARGRLAEAITHVPALADRADALEQRLTAARRASWPALQRVHGDYHLGQVLDVPGRGWVLIDFEGEPLRPLPERVLPDAPLRDVAGMLRSFDYVAATLEHEGHPLAAQARAAVPDVEEAFLAGYASVSGRDPRDDGDVLAALVLDKALYEVVYEARNRPAWVPIPVSALDRLTQEVPVDRTTQHPTEPSVPTDTPAPDGSGPVAASGGLSDAQRTLLDELAGGWCAVPHDVLGNHLEPAGLRVRVRRPMAQAVRIRFEDGEILEATHEHAGAWSVLREGIDRTMDYRVLTTWGDGVEHEQDDPYRFAPTVGEVDLHLVNEGRHEQLWTVLGARVRSFEGPLGRVEGTSFAVWAPRARSVHVIGDHNGWDATAHPMRALGSSGVWEVFIPGVGAGACYKYAIRTPDGRLLEKADPLARHAEVAPATASRVTSTDYVWGDGEWLAARAATDPHHRPTSIYEVHLGSWRQGSSYRDLAEHLVNYVSDLGFTHVELLPVMDHPYPPSWGYHVTSYYAPNARFGDPDDFRYLVDRLHQAGVGVILDWVPGHFATDPWALAQLDGQALYEHPDPRKGWHPEWGSHIFDFGRNEVRNFLVANALYWLEEFHVDGLRIDGVASMLYLDYSRKDGEWEPNRHGGRENLEAVALLQEVNATAYRRHPGVVIVAEESTAWPGVTRPTSDGGLGFGMKWNMGWMNDSLRYIAQDPIHRQYHHNLLTFPLMYAYAENYLLPISHDEVVHGKGSMPRKIPGSFADQLATLRAYYAYMWAHPGKQLLFMGCEFAQTAEWADGRSLDWWLLDHPEHYRVHNLVKELNRVYADSPAMWALDSTPAGFEWLDADDNTGNTFTFVRFGREDRSGDEVLAVAVNFGGGDRSGLRIGLPRPGRWEVVLDTAGYDAAGSPSTAGTVLEAQEVPWNRQPWSAEIRLSRLSTVYLRPID